MGKVKVTGDKPILDRKFVTSFGDLLLEIFIVSVLIFFLTLTYKGQLNI